MRTYVASSWRNLIQQDVVRQLRLAGHDVYDFRNPAPGDHGFAWSDIDPRWEAWDPAKFRMGLEHPVAIAAFNRDLYALAHAEATVLVMPCGRSAHMEFGFAVGARQITVVLLSAAEPELMYRMANSICLSVAEVIKFLGVSSSLTPSP